MPELSQLKKMDFGLFFLTIVPLVPNRTSRQNEY